MSVCCKGSRGQTKLPGPRAAAVLLGHQERASSGCSGSEVHPEHKDAAALDPSLDTECAAVSGAVDLVFSMEPLGVDI